MTQPGYTTKARMSHFAGCWDDLFKQPLSKYPRKIKGTALDVRHSRRLPDNVIYIHAHGNCMTQLVSEVSSSHVGGH